MIRGNNKDPDEKVKKRRPGLFSMFKKQQQLKSYRSIIKIIRNLIVLLIIIALFFILTSKNVNQKELLEKIITIGKNIGLKIANFLKEFFNGEGPLPLEATESGIYRK